MSYSQEQVESYNKIATFLQAAHVNGETEVTINNVPIAQKNGEAMDMPRIIREYCSDVFFSRINYNDGSLSISTTFGLKFLLTKESVFRQAVYVPPKTTVAIDFSSL